LGQPGDSLSLAEGAVPSFAFSADGSEVLAVVQSSLGAATLSLLTHQGEEWVPLGDALPVAGHPTPTLRAAPDGSLRVARYDRTKDGPMLSVARWSPDGWTDLGGPDDEPPDTLRDAGELVDFTLDREGNPVLAWLQLNASDGQTTITVERYTGIAWS